LSPVSVGSPVLACVTPPALRAALAGGLEAAGFRAIFAPLPTAAMRTRNGWVSDVAQDMHGACDGLIVVSPKGTSPRWALPAPVVEGLPVGLVCADGPEDLVVWLAAVSAHQPRVRAVLATERDSYLTLGQRFARWLSRHHDGVEEWMADTVDRLDLCTRLATGPRLAVYLGHGRPTGFCGYLGVRWTHLDAVTDAKPAGVVLAFACDTLRQTNRAPPFGMRWVSAGRSATYVGSVTAVLVRAQARLVHLAGDVLGEGPVPHVGELLSRMDARLRHASADPHVLGAFQTLRIAGNPLHPL
jgi:hypothetical protein